MHEFKYIRNNLYCEKVKVEDLAREYGTPLYIYSYHTLIDHFLKLKKAFASIDPLICYSVKANSNLAILKALVDRGAGLDIVSGGELFRALKVNCPAEKIVYASVGKTGAEIEEAVREGILMLNVESLEELENVNRISHALNKVSKVAIRINPDVEAKTHKFITTGKLTNKFGIGLKETERVISLRHKLSSVQIAGVHIHIGSQITTPEPFVNAISRILQFIQALEKKGVKLEYFNIGGGLGIIYSKEKPQTADIFARRILPLLKKSRLKIILEPGRFIAGNAGILAVKVLYNKAAPKKNFLVVDAGMNDLIRPALYEAYHEILPAKKVSKPKLRKVDVVGPICESGDFLAKNRKLPEFKAGDYLAVMSAGAYGFAMASNYNSRRRPAEVLVARDKVFVIGKRETFDSLIQREQIPPFLPGLI